MTAERKDVWASGDAYEPYVGRWSRLIARQFVTWLGVPPNKDWLDVGSGTGALCEVILAGVNASQLTGDAAATTIMNSPTTKGCRGRHADFYAALFGCMGALTQALLAEVFIRVRATYYRHRFLKRPVPVRCNALSIECCDAQGWLAAFLCLSPYWPEQSRSHDAACVGGS